MAIQSRVPTVLLTRPAPQSQRFAQELLAKVGPVEIVQSPLMQVERLAPTVPNRPYTALILTSETGAEAAGQLLQAGCQLPMDAFCVGGRTAMAARMAGFRALSADGDVVALAAVIQAHDAKGPLLHLHGEHRAGHLAETLTKGGIETDSIAVYSQNAKPLTAEGQRLLQANAPCLVPIFSPRSASLLAQVMPTERTAPLWIVAISEAAATAALPLRPDRLVIADHPDGENMLQAVAALLSADAKA
jgi:uroporphyrinogen-III synthase